jgi:hypothetical protein
MTTSTPDPRPAALDDAKYFFGILLIAARRKLRLGVI